MTETPPVITVSRRPTLSGEVLALRDGEIVARIGNHRPFQGFVPNAAALPGCEPLPGLWAKVLPRLEAWIAEHGVREVGR